MKAWKPCNAPMTNLDDREWGWFASMHKRVMKKRCVPLRSEFIFKKERWPLSYAQERMYEKWADEYLDRLRDEL